MFPEDVSSVKVSQPHNGLASEIVHRSLYLVLMSILSYAKLHLNSQYMIPNAKPTVYFFRTYSICWYLATYIFE